MLASKRCRLRYAENLKQILSNRIVMGVAQVNNGKSIDQAQAPKPAALSVNQTATAGEQPSHGPDLSRRRLIRGAAGIAPVVITLRSGALAAAASCVNTKATVVTTGSSGNITGYTTGSSATIHAGDNCVAPYYNSLNNGGACPSPSIDSKWNQPLSTQQGTVGGTSPNFTCAGAPNTNVAIISASITSFAAAP
jgi:hypothetical protein